MEKIAAVFAMILVWGVISLFPAAAQLTTQDTGEFNFSYHFF